MALSLFRNGFRIGANVFDKKTVFSNVTSGVKKDFYINMIDATNHIPLLNVLLTKQPFRDYSKHVKHQHGREYSSESESDSDLDVVGHRGESSFWRRKIRTFHAILDVNKDGVISFEDFKLLADRFVNLGHLSGKHTKEFRDLLKDLWEKRWGEITPYNLVTVEQYLEDMHHVLNDKSLVRRAHSFLPYLFKAVDKDKSGKITIEEYKLFFECLGLPEADAILAFRAIDSNGDGKVTCKEFVKHGRDFFLTEDENRISKYFWGPLVN